MYNFLYNKYGDRNTASKFLDFTSTDGKRRWIWKYTTFNSILMKYKNKLGIKCVKQIISFGDGTDEARALSKYCKEYDVICNHINFVSYPTIIQLQEQWKYVTDHIVDLTVNEYDKRKCKYISFSLDSLFKCDNNKYGTGQCQQLKAIATYLQLWMS